MQAGKIWVKR